MRALRNKKDLREVETQEITFFNKFYEDEAFNPVGCRLRLRREMRSLQQAVKKASLGRVLSLGCGAGQFESMLSPWAEQVVALDISPQAIQLANLRAERAQITNIDFRCLPLSELHLEDQFDLIICLAFLHHVPEVELPGMLQRCFSLLKPGGFFYSQDPNKNGLLRKIGRAVMEKSYDHYHSPDEREIDPVELKGQLESTGFGPVTIRYLDLTLIPAMFFLAKGPSWPLYFCPPIDYLWCHTPLARWASGFVAAAEKPQANCA